MAAIVAPVAACAASASLAFEREIGKLFAYQDALALVTAQRTNRTLSRFSQALAAAVLLPL